MFEIDEGWECLGNLDELMGIQEYPSSVLGAGFYILIEKTDSAGEIYYYIGKDSRSLIKRLQFHYSSMVNGTYLVPLDIILNDPRMEKIKSAIECIKENNNPNTIVREKEKFVRKMLFQDKDLFSAYIDISFNFRKRVRILYKSHSMTSSISDEEKTLIASFQPIENRRDTNGAYKEIKSVLMKNTEKFCNSSIGQRYVCKLRLSKRKSI